MKKKAKKKSWIILKNYKQTKIITLIKKKITKKYNQPKNKRYRLIKGITLNWNNKKIVNQKIWLETKVEEVSPIVMRPHLSIVFISPMFIKC